MGGGQALAKIMDTLLQSLGVLVYLTGLIAILLFSFGVLGPPPSTPQLNPNFCFSCPEPQCLRVILCPSLLLAPSSVVRPFAVHVQSSRGMKHLHYHDDIQPCLTHRLQAWCCLGASAPRATASSQGCARRGACSCPTR